MEETIALIEKYKARLNTQYEFKKVSADFIRLMHSCDYAEKVLESKTVLVP